MDPFEVRMQFIALISRLTSSLISIQKVSSFAVKHGQKCGDDIWDCLAEECAQINLNQRINLLFFLDTLLENSTVGLPYRHLVKRDLANLVQLVVPQSREGILNLMSADQVLRSWKTRRILDAEIIDPILETLQQRRATLRATPHDPTAVTSFSKADILRRIEDDRERHKRLREKIWVLPVPTTQNPSLYPPSDPNSAKTSPASPSSPAEPSHAIQSSTSRQLLDPYHNKMKKPIPPPLGPQQQFVGPELAIEIEFEQLWEASEEEELRTTGENYSSRAEKRRKIDAGELDESMEEGELPPPLEEYAGWTLTETELNVMRKERDRCFVPSIPSVPSS